ncbi:MAG: Gfo/Idh/MocA family oxidoreductase, partial [Chloroflexi bacterium]|nr:Gfo/Idh/MocA family oxidoreductase [Chloroflexota bacterium]
MKIAITGNGAFGTQHMRAIQNIPDIEVISITGGRPEGTEEFARTWKIPHWTSDLGETLAQPGLEAVIITSPTGIHVAQAEMVMRAGKHVLIE